MKNPCNSMLGKQLPEVLPIPTIRTSALWYRPARGSVPEFDNLRLRPIEIIRNLGFCQNTRSRLGVLAK